MLPRVKFWEALKIYLVNQRNDKQVNNYVYKKILGVGKSS